MQICINHATTNSTHSSSQYIILLILVFLLELSAGTVAYIYERNVADELNMTLGETFIRNYAVSERVTKAVDLMQQSFMCCGAVRFEEYRESVWLRSNRDDMIRERDSRLVPDSCCVTMTPQCGLSDHPSNIPYTVSTLMTFNQNFHSIQFHFFPIQHRVAFIASRTLYASNSSFSAQWDWVSALPSSSESSSVVLCTSSSKSCMNKMPIRLQHISWRVTVSVSSMESTSQMMNDYPIHLQA